MGKGTFLGEFEQLVLLAVIRLEANAYGVTIRRSKAQVRIFVLCGLRFLRFGNCLRDGQILESVSVS